MKALAKTFLGKNCIILLRSALLVGVMSMFIAISGLLLVQPVSVYSQGADDDYSYLELGSDLANLHDELTQEEKEFLAENVPGFGGDVVGIGSNCTGADNNDDLVSCDVYYIPIGGNQYFRLDHLLSLASNSGLSLQGITVIDTSSSPALGYSEGSPDAEGPVPLNISGDSSNPSAYSNDVDHFKETLENEVIITDDNEEEGDGNSCEDTGDFSWGMCPLLRLISSGLEHLDNQVQDLLRIDEDRYGSDELREAWGNIRNIAYILLVPAMLVMVIGTALGFEFVSAYTVKKALPRMVAATIFIAFSFEITVFLIELIHGIGAGIRGIMTHPFSASEVTLASVMDSSDAAQFGAYGIAAIGVAAAVSLGPGGGGLLATLGGFFLIAIIVITIAYAILILRQMLIIALMLLAPLAILAWIFPSNTKLWSLWKGVFIKLLLMYPLIMLVLGAGQVLATLMANEPASDRTTAESILYPVMIVMTFTLPYVFVPFAFKFVGGTIGRLAGMATGAEGGMLRKIRGRGKEARQIANAPKKQQKQESAQRRSQNRLYNRGLRKRARAGDESAKEAYGEAWSNRKPTNWRRGRQEEKDADFAILGTEIAKGKSGVRSGYAIKQAADIEAQAGAINAERTYTNEYDKLVASGTRTDKARDDALAKVAQVLKDAQSEGNASQALVTGTKTFLATNKSIKELDGIQDHEASLSGDVGTRARQQASAALGNQNAYAAMTGLHAGYKIIPNYGDDMKERRGKAVLTEQLGKVASNDAKAWTQAAGLDTESMEKVAERLSTGNAMGGPTAQNLQIPQLPIDKTTGAVNTKHADYATIQALHDHIKTKARTDPAMAELAKRLG